MKEIKVVQYEKPPLWMEMGGYLVTLGMFAGVVVTGNVYILTALASCLMYWNYKLFRVIGSYVNEINRNEINKLITLLDSITANNTEDGTIPVQESLTKEGDSDETQTIDK